MKFFLLTYLPDNGTHKSYLIEADICATIQTVWDSQKCWFSTGQRVVITDQDGNKKEFIKE